MPQFYHPTVLNDRVLQNFLRDYERPNIDLNDIFINVEQVKDGVARFVGPTYYGVYRMGVGISSNGNKGHDLLIKTCHCTSILPGLLKA
jgi:hypothetical protein